MTFLIFNQGGSDPDETPTPYVSLLSAAKEEPENSISSIISEYLPDFVNQDHLLFADFIEAYYEWSGRKENPHGTSATLMDTMNIDNTLDSFVDYFKETYLHNFPNTFYKISNTSEVNNKTVLKNIQQFYSSKGSEKSYKFLFRILHNSGVDFYYPKTDILKVSDGKWVEKKSIKVTSNNGTSNFSMKNLAIQQITSDTGSVTDAYANVENVYQYSLGNYSVTELFLTDINGTFTQGSDIQCTLSDGTKLVERIYSIPSNIIIHSGGVGYRSADEIDIDETSSEYFSGVGAKGSVSRVNTTGEIKTAKIDNFGVDYKASGSNTTIPITVRSAEGTGISGSVNLDALCSYPGYFANNDGKLSSNKRMRDNDLYQEYSYILKTEVSLDSYKKQIKDLVHPAGNKLFGNISLFDSSTTVVPYSSELNQSLIPIIGRYTPYTLDTQDDLRSATGSGSEVDLYPNGFNPGATSANHCLGNTGGRLAIVCGTTASPVGGLTVGSFRQGEAITGSTTGTTGNIFLWNRESATGGVVFIYTGGTGGALGFTANEMITATGGATATIRVVSKGNGTVYEFGSPTHVTAGAALTAGATAYGATAYWDIGSSLVPPAGVTSTTVFVFDETHTGYTTGYDFSIGNVVTQESEVEGTVRRGTVMDWIPGASGTTGSILKIEKISGDDFTSGTLTEIDNHDGSISIVYGMTFDAQSTIRNKVKQLKLNNVVKLPASKQYHSDYGYTGF